MELHCLRSEIEEMSGWRLEVVMISMAVLYAAGETVSVACCGCAGGKEKHVVTFQ